MASRKRKNVQTNTIDKYLKKETEPAGNTDKGLNLPTAPEPSPGTSAPCTSTSTKNKDRDKGESPKVVKLVSPNIDIHYERVSKGVYKCLKEGCEEPQGGLLEIRNHTKGCFEELKDSNRHRSVNYRKENTNQCREYNKKYRATKILEGKNLAAAGEEPKIKCEYSNCDFKCHNPLEMSKHRFSHKRTDDTCVAGFFERHGGELQLEDVDFQHDDLGSEGILSPLEHELIKVINTDRRDLSYVVYFVLVVDKQAKEHESLVSYLRANLQNSSCAASMYVGKKTGTTNHRIDKDHFKRTQSTIIEACSTGDKIAYEILRHFHKTKESMEIEEGFWQLVGGWRNVATRKESDGTYNEMKWEIMNKRYEKENMKQMSEKIHHDAYKVGTRNIPFICLDENCPGEECHNKEKREYYGLFHLEESKIKLLSFNEDSSDEESATE